MKMKGVCILNYTAFYQQTGTLMYQCAHTHTYTCSIHAYAHTYICFYIHILIHAHTYIHIHTYTHSKKHGASDSSVFGYVKVPLGSMLTSDTFDAVVNAEIFPTLKLQLPLRTASSRCPMEPS